MDFPRVVQMFQTISFIFIALLSANNSFGNEISGHARVMDGDTIEINSTVIRLHGIDSPENAQNCQQANGKKFNCGAAAENELKKLVVSNVTCSGDQIDDFDRLVAICTSGNKEINSAMVKSGWALAYRKFSNDYVAEEDDAKFNERGLWAGSFDTPWDFRAERWSAASQTAPDSECPIKGNINREGVRIYHAPWSRSYSRTKINTAKGERWFCNEAEALAAGWRAPLR